MKKSITKIITSGLLFIFILSIAAISSHAKTFSQYDMAKKEILQRMQEDPSVKLAEIYYKANKNIDTGIFWDIDPDRMIWVFTFEHAGLFDYNGVMLRDVIATTAWDAVPLDKTN